MEKSVYELACRELVTIRARKFCAFYRFLPAALRAAQTCRYLVYSEATGCTDGVKFGILLRFDRNLEYKRPAGAYPLRDFHKICRVFTSFQDALGVKIWLDLL